MLKLPKKKKIYRILITVLLLTNIIAAIIIFTDIQVIKSPKTDVEIMVTNITADDLTLKFHLKINNPNKFEISVEDLKIESLTTDGESIGKVDIKGGSISSDDTKTYVVSEKIKFNEYSDFKSLDNRITGKIGVGFLGFIKKTIPIELNIFTTLDEIIDNIAIPDIDLEFGFEELTEDGLEFTAGISVYNPNNIGIYINELNLSAINDYNEGVGNFKITGGEIKPKGNSFFNSKGILQYNLIDTKELILSLSGNASVKIAGMNKSIALSTEMNVNLPDMQEFIFQGENIKFYIPVQFKLTFNGILANVGFKYYNPSNITLVTRNINCSIHRVDGDEKTQLGIESMEDCIVDPREEVCVKTEILIPYRNYLKAGGWKILPDWIVLTIDADLAIAGTRQAFPVSLNAYVNPNLFKNNEFTE
jgi:LEA14-like dessication related protein